MLWGLKFGCRSISYRKCVHFADGQCYWLCQPLMVFKCNEMRLTSCLFYFYVIIIILFIFLFIFTVITLNILLNSDHATAEKETLRLQPHYGSLFFEIFHVIHEHLAQKPIPGDLQDRRGAGQVSLRNRVEISVLMCEQKSQMIWFLAGATEPKTKQLWQPNKAIDCQIVVVVFNSFYFEQFYETFRPTHFFEGKAVETRLWVSSLFPFLMHLEVCQNKIETKISARVDVWDASI